MQKSLAELGDIGVDVDENYIKSLSQRTKDFSPGFLINLVARAGNYAAEQYASKLCREHFEHELLALQARVRYLVESAAERDHERVTDDDTDRNSTTIPHIVFQKDVSEKDYQFIVERLLALKGIEQAMKVRDYQGYLPHHYASQRFEDDALCSQLDPVEYEKQMCSRMLQATKHDPVETINTCPLQLLVELSPSVDKRLRKLIKHYKTVPSKRWSDSLLLVGPPKCGKKTVLRALAHEVGFLYEEPNDFLSESSTIIGGKIALLNAFKKAVASVEETGIPTIIYLGNVYDWVKISRKDDKKTQETYVALMMKLQELKNKRNKNVIVSASVRFDDKEIVDQHFKRRMKKTIRFSDPCKQQRIDLLKHGTRSISRVQLSKSICDRFGEATYQMDCQDIIDITEWLVERNDEKESTEQPWIVEKDLLEVVDQYFADRGIQNYAARMDILRNGFSCLTFDDLHGMDDLIQQLRGDVQMLANPELKEAYQGDPSRVMLLYGPPGTGKTSLARAVSHELNEQSEKPWLYKGIAATEFKRKYHGEGAARVREFFAQALDEQPCVIFIDELDLLGSRDSDKTSEADKATLAQLWLCVDEFDDRKAGVVIAATNFSRKIDSTLSRRFELQYEVGLPDVKGRYAILLETLTKKQGIGADVDQAYLRHLAK